jgi:hypothetical protein
MVFVYLIKHKIMAYEQRKDIIGKIEKKRGTKVITLILSDRLSTIPIGGITGQVAPDQVPQIVAE